MARGVLQIALMGFLSRFAQLSASSTESSESCGALGRNADGKCHRKGDVMLQFKKQTNEATVSDSVCKSWCATNSNEWDTKCGYTNCAGCDDCSASGGSEEGSEEPAAVDCDGNCAKDKTYTCHEEMTVCEDTKMTGEGPYDWTINTITPMGYEKDVPCEEPKFWVEVDLGQKTSFNKIVFLRPKRSSGSPTGWCGTRIEVDGNVVYEHSDYENNEEKASDGNKMDIVTVLANDIDSADTADTWQGQKIKVYSGSNYKNSKVNWTAHFSGLEVYKV